MAGSSSSAHDKRPHFSCEIAAPRTQPGTCTARPVMDSDVDRGPPSAEGALNALVPSWSLPVAEL